MFDTLYKESLSRAAHRVWILSDLQQSLPENTRRCLNAGITDFEELGRPAEQIWYLGDAVEGADAERLTAMCRLQEDAFASLDIPALRPTGPSMLMRSSTIAREASASIRSGASFCISVSVVSSTERLLSAGRFKSHKVKSDLPQVYNKRRGVSNDICVKLG